MLAYRSTMAAVTLAGAVLGCADPEQPTDLRKDGPPSVTTVMILSDLTPDRIVETATYCRLNDVKRPGLVGLPDIRVIQVCPEDLTQPAPQEGKVEAAPPVWFARVVFDELLDPDVEELVTDASGRTYGTLQNTQPVTLTCKDVAGNDASIPYDGYYVPNGNRLSWPLGPALYIQPNDAQSAPTGTTCTVSVKDNVHNKAGQQVTEKRDFQFKIGPMVFQGSSPDPADGENGSIEQDPTTPVAFSWTAALRPGTAIHDPNPTDPNKPDADIPPISLVDPTSFDNTKVSILSGTNNADGSANSDVCNGTGTPVPADMIRTFLSGDPPDPTTDALTMLLDIGGGTNTPATMWAENTTYLITFAADATVNPAQGIAPGVAPGTFPADFKLCFHTPAPSP